LAWSARLPLERATKLGVAILIATPITITSAFAGNSDGGASAMTLVADGKAATVLWQRAIAGGDVVESWRVGDVFVTAAALPRSIVTVSSMGDPGGPGGAGASVTLPAIDKNGPNAAALAVQRYASSGRSVQSEALAVGFSATEIETALPSLPSHFLRRGSSATVSPGQIYNSGCVDVAGNSNQTHGHACIVQKLMQDNGGGDWYVGDEITSSGWGTDYWWKLSGLQAWDQFGANNTIVQYSPQSTQHPSACGTVTFSLAYNGIGVSASSNVCPDRLDPKFWGSTGFGTNWTGCAPVNYVESAPGVDVDHNPWNASQYASINVYIWWNCP
jgi:hypothetical protein